MFIKQVFALLFIGYSFGEEEALEDVRDYINTWNWDVECWGEQNVLKQRLHERKSSEYCLQLPTVPITTNQFTKGGLFPYLRHPASLQPISVPTNYVQSPYISRVLSPSLIRGKRQAYTSSNDIREFLEEVEEFAEEWDTKLSNLTCVLKTMGYMNEDFTLKRASFQSEFFSKIDITATDNLADPVWRQKTTGMLGDCLDTAGSVPPTQIDNNPVSRKYGPLARVAIFVKCAKVRYIWSNMLYLEIFIKICGIFKILIFLPFLIKSFI